MKAGGSCQQHYRRADVSGSVSIEYFTKHNQMHFASLVKTEFEKHRKTNPSYLFKLDLCSLLIDSNSVCLEIASVGSVRVFL